MNKPTTESARLAEEYVRLGGKRKAKLDDNIVSNRLWEDEPTEAAEFWQNEIETLSDEKRREVEGNLPNMNPE